MRRARIASPWSPQQTANVIAADWFGAVDLPATREQAMKVPAVVAARNLICLALSQGVLKAYRGDVEIDAPVWCYRTDSDTPPPTRLMWTVDDLFFSGYSLWSVARTKAGAIGDAIRVPPERWDWGEQWQVLVDGEPVNASDAILFTGWDDGLLYTGSAAIRHSLEIFDEVARRVRIPQAHTKLKASTSDVELEDDERDKLLADYAAARRSREGAVSWIPYGIEVDEGGAAPVSLYEQGRNAAVLDIARLAGIPAALLDASGVAASLTYESTVSNRVILNDRRRDRAGVIEARLSMDDVTPRGTRIALDLSALTGPDEGLPAPRRD